MATAFVFTSRTATIGSPTSCAASPSAPRTSASCCAIFSVRNFFAALLLAANRNAVPQRDQNRIQFLRRIHQPVEFLHAKCRRIIWRRRPRGLARPQRIVGNEQASPL